MDESQTFQTFPSASSFADRQAWGIWCTPSPDSKELPREKTLDSETSGALVSMSKPPDEVGCLRTCTFGPSRTFTGNRSVLYVRYQSSPFVRHTLCVIIKSFRGSLSRTNEQPFQIPEDQAFDTIAVRACPALPLVIKFQHTSLIQSHRTTTP